MPSTHSVRPQPSGPVLLQSGRTTYELIRPLEQTFHGELLLAKRHFDLSNQRTRLVSRLHALARELSPGGIAKELNSPTPPSSLPR